MPWPEGVPAWLRNAYAVIEGAVAERLSTADIIASLRPYATAAAGGWGRRGVIYVSQLRSIAARGRLAADEITKAGFTGPVTAQMIAEAPWSRTPAVRQAAPSFLIRAQVSSPNPDYLAGLEGAAPEVTQWVSSRTSVLPPDLQTLASQIASKAEDEGSPPLPITGISRMSILEE